jgi:glycosyltransferase involved in cell wall biosynthesis
MQTIESNENITVSICCLTFNHEDFIAQTLDGFLLQKTNFDFEIIVHDDCSTDGTRRVIESYQEKYPNLIRPIFQSQNQYSLGLKPIFTHVFPNAKGNYIALCEGDDYWTDPLKLQKQVDFLEANQDFAICSHITRQISEFGHTEKLIPAKKSPSEYNLVDFLKANHVATASLLINREYMKVFPDWIAKMKFGDWTLILFVLCMSNKKLGVLTDEMAVYRVHAGGVHGVLHKDNKSLIKAYRDHLHFNEYIHYYLFQNDSKYASYYRRKRIDVIKKIFELSRGQRINFIKACLYLLQLRLMRMKNKMS